MGKGCDGKSHSGLEWNPNYGSSQITNKAGAYIGNAFCISFVMMYVTLALTVRVSDQLKATAKYWPRFSPELLLQGWRRYCQSPFLRLKDLSSVEYRNGAIKQRAFCWSMNDDDKTAAFFHQKSGECNHLVKKKYGFITREELDEVRNQSDADVKLPTKTHETCRVYTYWTGNMYRCGWRMHNFKCPARYMHRFTLARSSS